MNEIDEMLHEDFLCGKRQIEHECEERDRELAMDTHKYIGECVFCGGEIHSDDVEYVLNEATETGICYECLSDKCVWR